MSTMFANRIEAGRTLAEQFHDLRGRDDVIVLALPRGGVPVAAEVARAINAPLDILLVRKIGVPWQPELAMGAICRGASTPAGDDELVLDHDIIAHMQVPADQVEDAILKEREVLRQREERYRGSRPAPSLRDKTVLLIDDGLATGTTMRVAITAVKRQQPAQVLVGVPVGSPDRVPAIGRLVDRIECISQPRRFMAVGQFYDDFRPTTDDEVIAALAR